MNQTVKAIQEAEAYPGPSLIIAYSPCEEHGYDLAQSHEQMKQLTATGFWPLYRYDPRRSEEGKAPLALDSRAPAHRWPRPCSRSPASSASSASCRKSPASSIGRRSWTPTAASPG